MQEASRGDVPGEARQGEAVARLLEWFGRQARDLPWRRPEAQRDPYRIWLAEMMLQQTRVEAVIPYYERFLRRFPGLRELAAASEEEVLLAWQGLGYYSRARHLHQAAQRMVEQHGARVPDTRQALRSLPGVGEYTAGAVASIAFGRDEPAVDGNTLRVMARFFGLAEDVGRTATRRRIGDLVRRLLPRGRAGAFNQAVMDLANELCLPRRPRCIDCPLAVACAAHRSGRAEALPVRGRREPPAALSSGRPVVQRAVAVVALDGRYLLRRRPSRGLLAGLWEFPGVECGGRPWPPEPRYWQARLTRCLRQEWGLPVAGGRLLVAYRHDFSHLRWEVRAFSYHVDGTARRFAQEDRAAAVAGGRAEGVQQTPAVYLPVSAREEGPAAARWVGHEELARYPLPVAFRPILHALSA